MARWRGKTAERGYGSEHARLRAQWKPTVDTGRASCHAILCLKPDRWIPPGTPWHLGHTPDRTAWTGPEHEHCGTADGARRGNQARQFTPASAGANVICPACGKPYHYTARACEMCGGHYHPSYGEQRTCGRACGRDLQQRNKRATGWLPKAERPKLPRKLGPVQSGERDPMNGWPSSRLQHYTCRYCGSPGVVKATTQPREVCPARPCQLARRAANNLRVRKGLTKEDADAQVTALIAACAPSAYGRWKSSRRW